MSGLHTEGNNTNYSMNLTLGNDYVYGKKLNHDKEGVEKSN